MFWLSQFKDYWLKIVTGDFGAWKTKNIFQDAFNRKQKYPDWLLIANIPYDFVDLYFSTKEDLDKILEFISHYIAVTNTIDRFKKIDFPFIRIIIDEAHLYFFSRDFKSLNKTALQIITQCRKRFIQVDFVTQELAQLDVFMRRLMPYVMNYEKRLFGFQRATMYYFKVAEVSDIWDELKVEALETEYLRPDKIQKYFNKKLQHYFDQKYLTYHVIWVNEELKYYTFPMFLELVEKHRQAFLQQIFLSSKKNMKNVADRNRSISQKTFYTKELPKNNESPWHVAGKWFSSHSVGSWITKYIWMKLFGKKYMNTTDVFSESVRTDTIQEVFDETPDII